MSRPNFLLVTADQWRGDSLGAAGHPVVRTPNVDRLSAEGTIFLNHFAATAPCSPARASLYTGLYQMHHRVVSNGAPLDARFDNVSLAARRAGYAPTLFGYTDTAPDPRTRAPNDPDLATYEGVLPGFDVRVNLREDDATWLSWLARGRGGPRPSQDIHRPPPEPGERVALSAPGYAAEETQTAFLAEAFLDWLSEQTRPWFAHVSFLRPHPPFVVPEPYASMYDPADGSDFRRTAETDHPLNASLRRTKPLSDFLRAEEGVVSDLSDRDLRRIRAIYWGMITEVDAQIGRVAEAAGEETLLVLTSDHGEMMGDHRMLGKGGFFPESYHVPLVIRGPGVLPGQRVHAYTSAADVFPTLCEIMGVLPDHATDGRSLVPFLAGETPASWRNAALWEYDFRDLRLLPDLPYTSLHETETRLVARHDTNGTYVHSPAFDPLRIGDCEGAPEALLSDLLRLRDETLASRPLGSRPPGAPEIVENSPSTALG